jgi:fructose-bisphosphate aldolase class I
LTFSFGRALQNSAVKAWAGSDANLKVAQEKLIERCKANSEAQLGKYGGSKDPKALESLFVENYKY